MSARVPTVGSDVVHLDDDATAMLNILDDFSAEKANMLDSHRAVLNMLDDSAEERERTEKTHRAVVNILDDFADDRGRLLDTQRAILNMLDDSDAEQDRLQETGTAITNILIDFDDDRRMQDDLRRAMLNLLDDFDVANETAASANRELEIANREMEAFSYSVSHDLRGPLRAMDGFSQALIEDYGDQLDDTAKDFLRRIREGSQRMAELINGLLSLSRVSRQNMKIETVDLSAIAESIADRLRHGEPGRDVTFEISPAITVTGDPRLFAAAFTNLLENAWKFTSKHPSAVITFDSAVDDDGGQVFFVRDDGAGFDMANMEELFQPFARLHGQDEFEGTGIGLATVRRVIERHGGKIWMEGAVEQGATAFFTLPANHTQGDS